MELVRGGRMAFATGLMNFFEANDVHPTGKKGETLTQFLKQSPERIKLMMALKEKGLLPSRKLEGPDRWPLSEEAYWKECEYRLKEGREAPGYRRTWAQWYEEEKRHEYFAKEQRKWAVQLGRMCDLRRHQEKKQLEKQEKARALKESSLPSALSGSKSLSSPTRIRVVQFIDA